MAEHHRRALPLQGDLELRLAERVVRRHAHRARQRRRRGQAPFLAQDAHRDLERGVGRRHAAIDGALHQRFLDLRERHAAADRGLAVQLEFLPAREAHRHAEHEQAAGGGVEPGPAPDVVPGIAGDEALELGVECVRVVQRLVDPGVAQHRAAILHAAVEVVLSGHGVGPTKEARGSMAAPRRGPAPPRAAGTAAAMRLRWRAAPHGPDRTAPRLPRRRRCGAAPRRPAAPRV